MMSMVDKRDREVGTRELASYTFRYCQAITNSAEVQRLNPRYNLIPELTKLATDRETSAQWSQDARL